VADPVIVSAYQKDGEWLVRIRVDKRQVNRTEWEVALKHIASVILNGGDLVAASGEERDG
jgi:hypothetical protein